MSGHLGAPRRPELVQPASRGVDKLLSGEAKLVGELDFSQNECTNNFHKANVLVRTSMSRRLKLRIAE